MLVAFVVSPSAATRASTSATRASGTPERRKFCQTVRRMSPSPHARAIAATSRICATVSLPTGSTAPTQFSPAWRCGWTPTWAKRSGAGRGVTCAASTRASLAPSRASVAARKRSKPQASSTYFRRDLLRSVRLPFSMKTRTIASATAVHSPGAHTTPVSRARSRWPEMPPSTTRIHTPAGTAAPAPTSTAWKPMSFVSSSVGSVPAPSKATLNLRGRP